ncbi:extracellular matrix-binding protein ebh-like isoform X2 [Linepithema humile]|uniref:extracellular matrix-binding protein ebh-like isoform X2 n=1 Tax=Linepithema humile TaxID=83485 RepID=UPI00351EDAAD
MIETIAIDQNTTSRRVRASAAVGRQDERARAALVNRQRRAESRLPRNRSILKIQATIKMNNKYYIVEFEDGLQIVPNNWFTCKKKSAIYWPNVTNQKEYDKAVEKMKDFNNNNSTIISVKRIFTSTDTFIKAKEKLKLAEKLSDLNSDEDTEVLKNRRRFYAAKVFSSSSSEEEIQNPIKKRKIDTYPQVPQISKNSKLRNENKNKENFSSAQENEMQHMSSQYSNFSSDNYPKASQMLKNSTIRHQVLENKENFSSEEEDKMLMSSQNSNFSSEFHEFKRNVYRNFSVLKQKLDFIIQNQLDFYEQWERNENNSTTHFSTESNEINVMSQFPIESEDALNQLEEALIDNNYRNNLINKLSTIGGKNLKQLILNIIKRIFTIIIAKEYSWYGKKNNKSFSDLKLCSVVISAVLSQLKYPQSTEHEISEPIKSWLRHANEKIKKLYAAQLNI